MGAVHTLRLLVVLLSFLRYASGGRFLLYLLYGLGVWKLRGVGEGRCSYVTRIEGPFFPPCVMFPGGVAFYTFFFPRWGSGGCEAWETGAFHTLRVLAPLSSFLRYVTGGSILVSFFFGLGGWKL